MNVVTVLFLCSKLYMLQWLANCSIKDSLFKTIPYLREGDRKIHADFVV